MSAIRVMTRADIVPVFRIVDSMNWGYLEEDILRLIAFDPQGCFVAEAAGLIIGVNFTTSRGGYGFIGPVIVEEKLRGAGIGRALMQAAIDHLEQRGITSIELDSVFPAAPLYRRLGFKDRFFSYRMRRQIDFRGEEAQEFRLSMLDELLEFDRRLTGLDSSVHLAALAREFADSVYIIRDLQLRAYALVRRRSRDLFWLGPMLAEDSQSAIRLFEAVCGKHFGKTIALGILEPSRPFIEYLRRREFIHTIPGLRMCRGPLLNYCKNMYAIMAPEKG